MSRRRRTGVTPGSGDVTPAMSGAATPLKLSAGHIGGQSPHRPGAPGFAARDGTDRIGPGGGTPIAYRTADLDAMARRSGPADGVDRGTASEDQPEGGSAVSSPDRGLGRAGYPTAQLTALL